MTGRCGSALAGWAPSGWDPLRKPAAGRGTTRRSPAYHPRQGPEQGSAMGENHPVAPQQLGSRRRMD